MTELDQFVYDALDRWDEERHEANDRGSFGRLLFYVQEALSHRNPPSIANMTPGTRFLAKIKPADVPESMSFEGWQICTVTRNGGVWTVDTGFWSAESIDASTIRDVQEPPKVVGGMK